MSLQIVREYTTALAGQWCIETTQRPRQPKTDVAPAAATSEDLRRAFTDLLATLADEQRMVVVAEMRARRRQKSPRRELDTSPAAVAKARALFGF